jgi:hypothetical protein
VRTTTEAELELLHSFNRAESYQVKVKRRSTGALVDLTDRVQSISISMSNDEPVNTCDVEFDDSWTAYGAAASLSPLVVTSVYNDPAPLLWPNNELYVYVGFADVGEDVTDYKLLFHGILGDGISPQGTKGSRSISVSCRDQAKRLQDTMIVGEYLYGSEDGTAAVAVMQGILDQHYGDSAITLHVRDNPQFMVYPVRIGEQSVWDALQDILKPTGYQVRYWFIGAGQSGIYDCEGNQITITEDGFYLTVVDPGRDPVIVADELDEDVDTITEESLDISDDTVRNAFRVRYYDRFTKEYMEVARENATSIATYGRREMVVGQDDVPYIDTFNEAWDLMAVLDNDLSEAPATDRLICQMMYHLEPFDYLDVTSARLSTGTSEMGVRDLTFSMGPDAPFITTITGSRDRVIGQVMVWLTSSGGAQPEYPIVYLGGGSARSFVTILCDGSLRVEVILEVIPPPSHQVALYEWKWAQEGDGIWHDESTTGPVLKLFGLPAGVAITWTCRAKLVGGAR